MNAEAALQEAIRNPDFCSISGSRLYGTNRLESDYDYRGFVIPPFEYLIGDKSFNDAEIPGSDHKIYALKRFLYLASSGDPQMTELFFVPPGMIQACTSLGSRVMSLRDSVVSNLIYRRIMGYSYSEWRKAMGQKMVIEDRTKTEDDVIASIRNVFKPEKADMDDVVETLFKNKEKTIVPSKKTLGAKRRSEFDRFGFGVSSAAHSIRLVGQLAELMLTGNITFPRPNADILKAIRLGETNKEEAEALYAEEHDKAEKARDDSVLPDTPNRTKISAEYVKIVRDCLRQDPRFQVIK